MTCCKTGIHPNHCMENGPAPAEATTTTTVVLLQLKDPGTFCGTDDVDIEEWLPLYEHTSKNYRWIETLMLANILFYLKGTAKVWFENHEDEIGSWDACKEKMRALFGKSVGRKAAAAKMEEQQQQQHEHGRFHRLRRL
ncbi:uncharacterized protein LOC142775693 [Rhipicephalus microplus]|uniref:uncharacterized protein LOC142775693 n=1 Tax=Rhipicephalus microplus TaxID=6941 RepID=UPI003F6AB689